MNLHEYQSKELFASYGIPIPKFYVIRDSNEIDKALEVIGSETCVVKAQVHAGGRGKAGGVKLVKSKAEAVEFAGSLLGSNLVTIQTNEKGQPVNQVLIEQPCEIERELYLGAVLDRGLRKVVFMASTEGGVEIEKVAEQTPEKILKAVIHPLVGVQGFQGRDLAFGLGLKGDQIKQFTKLLAAMARMFVEKDLSLIEVNPLVVTKQGDLLCLDGKVNMDDNALYRQKALAAMRDVTQEDEREVRAKEWDLNYISLDGDIGCMVNGAGLAMATMDLIKLHGLEPANFLDVGGTATKERVAEAFKIILSDEKVKGILVNIFGGIVRCDMIAEGIVGAVEEVGVKIPVVVRLEGNNAGKGSEILNNSSLKVEAAANLNEAAQKIVALVGGAS